MWWHLEASQFEQAQTSGWTVGGVELIDAELGPMSVSLDVGQ
jgi:hypothetical protein